jgi:hypothetical protein
MRATDVELDEFLDATFMFGGVLEQADSCPARCLASSKVLSAACASGMHKFIRILWHAEKTACHQSHFDLYLWLGEHAFH